MKMQKGLKILLILLLAGIIIPGYSYGEILFEDNFDNHPDWSPKQQKYSIECWLPDYQVKDAPPPPDGYFAYRIGGSYFTGQGHNTLTIDSTNYRGDSGKGLTYWSESDDRFWASDADLFVLLDKDYEKLYVRFYIKFQSGWKWSTVNSPIQKFFRITHYNRSGNPFNFFAMGNHHPCWVADLAKYGGGVYPITYFSSWRYENVYYPHEANPPHDSSANFFFYDKEGGKKDFWDAGMPGDGNWHCWEFYLKMNSAIGVEDGVEKFWQDGILIAETKNLAWSDKSSVVIGTDGKDYKCIKRHRPSDQIPTDKSRPVIGENWQDYWVLSGTEGEGLEWTNVSSVVYGFSASNPRLGWNCIGLGGNNVNHYALNEEEFEQWYAIDDFVISTEYIGVDYIIEDSKADINADNQVNVLDVQLCVNVVLGIEAREEIVNKARQVTAPPGECNVLDIQAVVNEILNSV